MHQVEVICFLGYSPIRFPLRVHHLCRGYRTRVQISQDTAQGFPAEDDRVAISFRVSDAGRREEEAPLVPVGHKWRVQGGYGQW